MRPTLEQWQQRAGRAAAAVVRQPAFFGGRLLLIAILGLYFYQLWSYSRIGDYQYEWQRLGVPVLSQSFSDLRDILAGFDCTRLGYNVLIFNPCDNIRSNFNYPMVWMMLTPLGLRQADADWLGVGVGAVFYLSLLAALRPLNLLEGAIYGLILISPSLMLGVERGNMDLIMSALLCAAFLILGAADTRLGRLAAYGLVLVAAIFKLYPVFAFALALREKTRAACLAALGGFGLTFLAYFVSRLAEFRLVLADYPRTYVYSFGRLVLPQILSELGPLSRWLDVQTQERASILALAAVLLAAAALARLGGRRFVSGAAGEAWQVDAFRAGAAVYIGCFALGYNYDYRLVFLVFIAPLLFQWLKREAGFLRGLAGAGLASLVLTVWISRWSTFHSLLRLPDKLFFWDEFLNWFLLFVCCYGLFITLPDWLRPLFAPRALSGQAPAGPGGAAAAP